MNLQKLFEMQRQLDEYIEQKHPRQEGEDRLVKKILALQVEFGELANKWRGFKYWSNDQTPRTIAERGICVHCAGTGNAFFDDDEEEWEDCTYCNGEGEEIYNPLLEEYVDCLHFIMSIGLSGNIGTMEWEQIEPHKAKSTIQQFIGLFEYTSRLLEDITVYVDIWSSFIGLGEMLGFTWEQIEEAYMQKNAENHARQERGY